jgi:hypothetical protein
MMPATPLQKYSVDMGASIEYSVIENYKCDKSNNGARDNVSNS